MLITVRLAKVEDIKGLLQAQKSSWLATYSDIIPKDVINTHIKTSGKRYEQVKNEIRSDKNTRYWVAIVAGKIVGMCTAKKLPKHEIRAIYVRPSALGSGAGQKLFEKAIKWLGPNEDIVLWLEQGNGRARAFYQKNCFEMTRKKSKLDFHGYAMHVVMMRRASGRS